MRDFDENGPKRLENDKSVLDIAALHVVSTMFNVQCKVYSHLIQT